MAVVNGAYSNLGLHSANQMNQAPRHTVEGNAGIFDISDEVDGTPKAVAVLALAALVALFGLKQLGFRFAFGVKVGK